MRAALVAVEGSAYHFDKPYTYSVPEAFTDRAQPGARVTVPFGRGNRGRRGIITEITQENSPKNIKPLLSVTDESPLIPHELLELAGFIRERTFCTLYEALRLMLPAGLGMKTERVYSLNPELPPAAFLMLDEDEKRLAELLRKGPLECGKLLKKAGFDKSSGIAGNLERRGYLISEKCAVDSPSEAFVKMVRPALTDEEAQTALEGKSLTERQKKVLRQLLEAGAATVRELCYFTGVSAAVIKTLEKKGVVEIYDQRVLRNPYKDLKTAGEASPPLSKAQQEAFESLLSLYEQKSASAALLYGVTGSGKTQVFMKLIERARADSKGVIVLVPEISLTPQAVSRFYRRFGEDVAVLHSGLSVGERLDQWQRIRDGKAGIVVGTRSAVFAPVPDLGLIILDEEQEHTYKSESSPRYHARDAARFRCAKSGAMLLLASATPSVESYHAAKEGKYALVCLNERYGQAELPRVITVDLKTELQSGNDGPLSARLLYELKENLKRKEQSILLLNRRGYSTYISCMECGQALSCPNCSISLTWHAANHRLMCHYCGYSTEEIEICPACGSRHLRYSGNGTQKAEEILSQALPGARILRMDTDTTMARFAHEKILRSFSKGEADILIGTQMVAKGLDFPNVTLVGVLSADQLLFMEDFRAAERTFSLLTQVVGRSGRGSRKGRALIQTGVPENEVIRLAARQDYEAFYEQEIRLRRQLLYPPFCDLCMVGFTGTDEGKTAAAAQAFFIRLGEEILKRKGLPARLMSPSPASVYRVGGRYRYRLILKCRSNAQLRDMVSELLKEFGGKKEFEGVTVFADINPLSLL